MGQRGRPPKYTPKEAEENKKKNAKKRKEKHTAKVKSDPILHEKEKAQKRDWQAKNKANMTEEEKQADREYNTTFQRALRAKEENQEKLLYFLYMMLDIKKNETSINFQKALKAGHLKQFQQQVSCEQAEQLELFIK